MEQMAKLPSDMNFFTQITMEAAEDPEYLEAMRKARIRGALVGISLASPAYSQDVKLPPTMVVTAYDTGTAGFNITVGIGKMMKDKYGTDVRVLPAGNDVARLAPLKGGRAQASAMGIGVYFAQDGPEVTDMRFGIIALTDCSPIVIAHEKGFFKKHGINSVVSKGANWAAIRDSLSSGDIQGTHMLIGMPIASTSVPAPRCVVSPNWSASPVHAV